MGLGRVQGANSGLAPIDIRGRVLICLMRLLRIGMSGVNDVFLSVSVIGLGKDHDIYMYIYTIYIYIYILGAHFVACRSRSSLLVSTWLYTEFLGREQSGCLEMLNGLGFRV